MYPRDNWGDAHAIGYAPPTRLELATRGKAQAEAALDRATSVYAEACNTLAAAQADARPPKACTCCPTCGGTK